MYPYDWTAAQQAIIDRINSGQQDYTFGPGSPNPTREDLGTYVGGPHSPAGGFAVHGGVALAPKEYNMFSPEQRRYLGIMDVAPADQVGKVERYYGSFASSPSRGALIGGVPAPVSGGGYAAGVGSNPAQMSTMQDYGSAIERGDQMRNAGLALGNAMQQAAQSMARQQQTGNAQALQMLSGRPKNLAAYAPVPAVTLADLLQRNQYGG